MLARIQTPAGGQLTSVHPRERVLCPGAAHAQPSPDKKQRGVGGMQPVTINLSALLHWFQGLRRHRASGPWCFFSALGAPWTSPLPRLRSVWHPRVPPACSRREERSQRAAPFLSLGEPRCWMPIFCPSPKNALETPGPSSSQAKHITPSRRHLLFKRGTAGTLIKSETVIGSSEG